MQSPSAAKALGQLAESGDERAFAAVCAHPGNPDEDVRRAAVEALGQFKAHRSAGAWNVRLVGSGGVAKLDAQALHCGEDGAMYFTRLS